MPYSTSTLNRYFCKQFLMWFGIVMLFLCTVIGIFEGIELLRRSMSRPDIPLYTLLEMIILKIPSLIQRLLPFVVLLSGLLCFGRMQSNHESLAFQAIGYSIWQFLRGIALLSVALGLLNLSIVLPLTSAFTSRLAYLEETLFNRTLHRLSVGTSGIWLKEKSKKNQQYMIIHGESFTPGSTGLQQAVFYIFKDDNTLLERIDAPRATLSKQKKWILQNASVDGDFPQTKRSIPSSLDQKQLQESHIPPQAISFWDLPKTIAMLEKTGLSVIDYKLFWHEQIAKILMFVAMLVISVVFSFHFERHKSQTVPIVMALAFGFFIFFMSDIIYVLGLSQRLPIWLAAWIPPSISLLLGVAMLLHKDYAH